MDRQIAHLPDNGREQAILKQTRTSMQQAPQRWLEAAPLIQAAKTPEATRNFIAATVSTFEMVAYEHTSIGPGRRVPLLETVKIDNNRSAAVLPDLQQCVAHSLLILPNVADIHAEVLAAHDRGQRELPDNVHIVGARPSLGSEWPVQETVYVRTPTPYTGIDAVLAVHRLRDGVADFEAYDDESHPVSCPADIALLLSTDAVYQSLYGLSELQ